MQGIDQRLSREYARQRALNEQQREQRIAEAQRLDPGIRALQDELRQRFLSGTRDMLADKSQTQRLAQALRVDVARLQGEITGRLQALGLPPDHMELCYRCDACGDTGFLGEFGQRMCACYRLRRTELMREDAGLGGQEGQRFDAFDPGVFESDEQRNQAENAAGLCARYADGLKAVGKLNLILMGASGLGKTFLLNCVADRAITSGVPALPMTAFNMLAAMREYHFGANGGDSMLSRMLSCELLLIDDLGTEPMLRNITVEYLFMLLNERLNRRLHTVIATNLTPKDLLERYGERVLSRLMDRQSGEFIRLTGKDLRLRK